MEAYHRVYDLRHLEADCQEPGSAPEPYASEVTTLWCYTNLFIYNYWVLSTFTFYSDYQWYFNTSLAVNSC